uniref:V-SNARE coiled-coil homology domain-containing protein n=1 Tax=Poecilia reticulata TaxID=8081 RepID=A0A3P9PLS7_POERE
MTTNSHLQKQTEVDQVTMIMLDNKKKAEERYDNLNDLEQQAKDLQEKVAAGGAVQLENPSWLPHRCLGQSKKTTIIIFSVVAGLILLGLIIFVITKFAG